MIDDDTLILYYGDELDDEARRDVASALERDPQLAGRYARLADDLDRLRDAPLPVAGPLATARWQRAVTQAAAQDAKRKSGRAPLYALAAGLGTLAIGIAIGVRLGNGPAQAPTLPQAAVAPVAAPVDRDPVAPEPAFSRGLATYMQTARVQLVTLDPADNAARDALIDGLIANNRAFELAADERGAHDIARVLRAFDQVLRQLAEESASADDVRRNVDQLSFEYGAMLTRLAPQTSNQSHSL